MSDPNKRSVGDVPAPTINMKDAIEGAIPVLRRAVIEGEKLGRDAERAAVVKYLRDRVNGMHPSSRDARDLLTDVAWDIEQGEHNR